MAGSGLGKRPAVGIMKRRNPRGKRLQALRQQAFQPIARNEGMAGFDKQRLGCPHNPRRHAALRKSGAPMQHVICIRLAQKKIVGIAMT